MSAAPVRIAILTFEGFNEIDSLVAYHILNRVRRPGWEVQITAPNLRVKSMNGLMIGAQASLQEARTADAVIVGSGVGARELAQDSGLLAELGLQPSRQLIASQCSGALLLAKLGLLKDAPACTDLKTRPWLAELGVEILDRPFFSRGNVATAGGCLSSQYIAAWLIARLAGIGPAMDALHYVAPVGEQDIYVSRIMETVLPYLPESAVA